MEGTTAGMNSNISKPPGTRLFIAGCVTLFLFSAVHMIPMLLDLFTTPTEPLEVEAKRAMAAVVVDIGPFHTTFVQLNQLLSTYLSTLLLFVVALNLVALPAVAAAGRLRRLAAVNAIFVGVLLALAIVFQFPPPGVFSLLAGVFFIGALLRAGKAGRDPG